MATKRKKRAERSGRVFYPLYWSYVLLAVGAIVLMMRVLWDNMGDYEASMPKYVAQDVEKLIQSRDFAAMYDYDDTTEFAAEGRDAYVAYMNDLTEGFDISFKEKYSSNPNEKTYQISFGENKLGTYTLCKSGEKTKYGNELWTLKEIRNSVIQSSDYFITAPEGSTVYADGQALGEESVVESGLELTDDYQPEGYEREKWRTYSTSRCFRVPRFQVIDSAGREQSVLPNEEGRLVAQVNYDDEELKPQVEERVVWSAKMFAMYTSDDRSSSAVLEYVLPDSKVYQYVRGFDGGWFMPHRDVEFLNMRTEHYVKLDENTFCCNVYYDYKVIYRKTTETYPTAYTFYFTKDRNGEWLIFDFSII